MTKTKFSPTKALLAVGSISLICAGLIAPVTFAEGEEPTDEQLRANFEQCLVNAYNTENPEPGNATSLTDAQLATIKRVSCNNAAKVTKLDKLTSIEYLHINPAKDQTIDLSGNTTLGEVTILADGIENLQVTLPNTNLEHLYLRATSLRPLNLSTFSKLQTVELSGNVDVTLPAGNTLEEIGLYYNGNISKIDFSKFPKLKSLTLYDSDVQALDLSKNTELIELDINNLSVQNKYEGSLKEIDLSNNKKLKRLSIVDQKITELDLSNNPDIEYLELNKNDGLKKLDLSGLTQDDIYIYLGSDGDDIEVVAVPKSWEEEYTEEELLEILGLDEDKEIEIKYGALPKDDEEEEEDEDEDVGVPNTGIAAVEMAKYVAIVALPAILILASTSKRVIKRQSKKVRFSR